MRISCTPFLAARTVGRRNSKSGGVYTLGAPSSMPVSPGAEPQDQAVPVATFGMAVPKRKGSRVAAAPSISSNSVDAYAALNELDSTLKPGPIVDERLIFLM